MKFVLLLLLFVQIAHAECNKQIDPNKVMLFIDTNKSELEITTTEKAACERGQRLIIVPQNYKEMDSNTQKVIDSKKALEKCQKNGKACVNEIKFYEETLNEAKKISRTRPSIAQQTKDALTEIKNTGGKLHNLTISGHDGGGIFSGYKGGLKRDEIAEILKNYPEINEVSSLLLLGCYTGVPKEMIEWKQVFPGVKLIAGYDAAAPFSDKPAGHQYIEDVLLKEKQLLQNADQKKLQDSAKHNIRSLTMLNSSMYLICKDGTNEGEYYYGSQREEKVFKPFDIKECESKKTEIESLINGINKYDSGELEIPNDTTTGELRKIYTKARSIEHCGEMLNLPLNLNRVFNLLFYEGVKKNFSDFYQADLKEVDTIMSEFKFEDFEYGFKGHLEKSNKSLEEQKAFIALLETDPNGFISKAEMVLKNKRREFEKLLNDPKYAEVKHLLDPQKEFQLLPPGLPEGQRKLAQELLMANGKNNLASTELQKLKKNPSLRIKLLKDQLLEKEKNLETEIASFEAIKRDLSLSNKKIWIPTSDNLKQKSRKETQENLNFTHGLLSTPGLPLKQKQALSWMLAVTTRHLGQFQNPFSWHEYTGEVETIETPSRLNDYVKISFDQSSGGETGKGMDNLSEMMGPEK